MRTLLATTIVLAALACVDLPETTSVEPRHDVAGAPASAALTILGCQAKADTTAKRYFQWYFNVDASELHWYAEGYYQAGGARYNQPVRARAYWELSRSGTRTVRFDTCEGSTCVYYATYTCGCDGACALR